MPADTMKPVLVNIHLMEGWLEVQRYSQDSARVIADTNYKVIVEKHGLGWQQYTEAYQWYERHPEQMDELYQMVIDSLSVVEAEYQSKPKE